MRSLIRPNQRVLLATILALTIFPILLQLPLLLGFLRSNPILLYSGLGSGITQVFPGSPTIDPNIAFTSQSLGLRAAQDWLHGHVPWWNSYEGTGVPLAGEMQSGAFFLPFILLLVLPHGQLWFHIVLTVIAGVFTFFLLRQLGLPIWASLVGAILFEVNGTFSWLANAAVNPVAFLPVILYGIERVRAEAARGRIYGWSWMAVGVAYSIYAGFPETAYLCSLLAVVWGVVRLWMSPRIERARVVIGLVLGAGIGIAVAAPIIVAFADYMKYAYVGPGHGGSFGDAYLPLAGLAMLVWPYVFGPIFQFSASAGVQAVVPVLWGNVGGYTGVGLLALALAGLVGRKERTLRFALGGFVLIALAKTFGQPQISHLLNWIPLLQHVAFFRYADPAWELALCLLASFAIADMQNREAKGWPRLIAIAVGLSVSLLLLASAHTIISSLLTTTGYSVWLLGSLGLGIGSILLLVFALAARPRLRSALLGLVVIVESSMLFLIPVIAHPRTGTIHDGGITYLQTHLGLHRFYTLGPVAPNYGSAFAIASLNYNDLPIPQQLVSYVHRNLDPYANAIVFNGTAPRTSASDPSQATVVRSRLRAYEAAGVKFVVTPPGVNPFVVTYSPPTQPSGNQAYAVPNGESMSISVTSVPKGSLVGIGLLIGTYTSKSDGTLGIQVCQSRHCSYGSRSLANAKDNSYFTIMLSHPLMLDGGPLSVHVTDSHASYPFAIWLWPDEGSQHVTTSSAGPRPGWGAHMELNLAANVGATPPRIVYQGTAMDIFQTPHPASYFSATSCHLTIVGRTAVQADCSEPSKLVRLETYAPGWHASINGVPIVITRNRGLFQAIPLPAGHSYVQFWYEPPDMTWALLALVLGVLSIATTATPVAKSVRYLLPRLQRPRR